MGAEEQVGPIVSKRARVLQSWNELTAFPPCRARVAKNERQSRVGRIEERQREERRRE